MGARPAAARPRLPAIRSLPVGRRAARRDRRDCRWSVLDGDRELFKPVVDNLLGYDPYMLLADYRSYVDRQEEVGRVWRDCERWTRASILNVARMGWF